MTPTKQEMIDKIYDIVKPTTFYEFDHCDLEYVMIGDVLDWMYESEKISTRKFNEVVENICKYNYPIMREYKRKPIEDQSDDCISYIYSLVTQ